MHYPNILIYLPVAGDDTMEMEKIFEWKIPTLGLNFLALAGCCTRSKYANLLSN